MSKKSLFMLIMTLVLVFAVGCAGTTKPADTKADSKTETKAEAKPEAAKETKLDAIKKAGKIVVATSADYPPYEFHAVIDGKDTIVGFEIAIAKAVAKELGVEIEIRDVGFDAVLADVLTGKADLGVAGISKKPERAAVYEFSKPYYTSIQTVLVRKADAEKYKSLENLKGGVAGVQIGTIQKKMAENAGAKSITELTKLSDLIAELKTGKVDYVINVEPVVASYAKQNADLVVMSNIVLPDESEASGFIAKKGEVEFMAEIDKAITKLLETKKVDEFVAEASKIADEQAAK